MNIYALIPLVAAAIYVFLLIVLLAHRPWLRRYIYLEAFLVGAILWSLSDVLFRGSFFADSKLLLARITLSGFVLMLIPLCHFIETFHHGQPKAPWLALGYLSLAATIALAALGYLPEKVVFEAGLYSYYNPALLLVCIGLPFLIIAARDVYYLWRRLRTAENPVIHNQITYLMVSTGILGVASLTSMTTLGQQVPGTHLGNVVIAGLLGYAILRGQLIDSKRLARKALVYAVLTAVLVAIYWSFSYLFHRLFDFELGFPAVVIATAVGVIVAVLSYPIRNVLNWRVDQLLYPKTHDYRRMLLDFSRKASDIIKIEELRSEITKLVAAAVGVKKVYLLTPDNTDHDYPAAFVSSDGGSRASSTLRVRKNGPLADWLLRQGRPLFREKLEGMRDYSDWWTEEMAAINKAEIEVFTPLINRGNLVGILALARKERAATYDMSDIDLISMLTHGVATAIANAELHARIEKLAITDMMTDVYNRHYFDDRTAEEIGRHTRYGGGFSLVLFDLDNFKSYNDTYGHREGDELLRQVARAARETVRNVDLVFRYGGDEFALLLPETAPGDAANVCERLRGRLASRMEVQGSDLTLSLGIAAWPEDGSTLDGIVRAADEALYHSKRSGGNRVSLFSEIGSPEKSRPGKILVSERSPMGMVEALVAAVNARDHYTMSHSRLVAAYAVALARARALTADVVNVVEMAALLHDVGKIGIPDRLLNKEGKLTPDEWETMKKHSRLAATIIGPVPNLAVCIPMILHNHERYDGCGYPAGLKGEAIPLGARILAIADAFGSMTSARCYRAAMRPDEAIEELRKHRGSQFDPELLDLFVPIARSGTNPALVQ